MRWWARRHRRRDATALRPRPPGCRRYRGDAGSPGRQWSLDCSPWRADRALQWACRCPGGAGCSRRGDRDRARTGARPDGGDRPPIAGQPLALAEDGSSLRPAYTIDGGTVPEQRERGLPGYPGGVDHVGNDAAEQFQLDVFGEALHLFGAAARHGPLTRNSWKAVEIAVDAIADNWWRPDGGIWELERRRWTHSRQILVSGLERVAGLAPHSRARDWQELANRIDDTLHRSFVHSSGRWQRAADDPELDASLLIPVLRADVDLDEDPVARRTVRALQRGVRRRPTPATRKPAPGLRARGLDRGLRVAEPLSRAFSSMRPAGRPAGCAARRRSGTAGGRPASGSRRSRHRSASASSHGRSGAR